MHAYSMILFKKHTLNPKNYLLLFIIYIKNILEVIIFSVQLFEFCSIVDCAIIIIIVIVGRMMMSVGN